MISSILAPLCALALVELYFWLRKPKAGRGSYLDYAYLPAKLAACYFFTPVLTIPFVYLFSAPRPFPPAGLVALYGVMLVIPVQLVWRTELRRRLGKSNPRQKNKILPIIAFSLSTLLIASFGLWQWTIQHNITRLDELCKIPPGSSVEKLLGRARELGFKTGEGDFMEFSVTGPGMKLMEAKGENLDAFTSGRIGFVKFRWVPFDRDHCYFEMKDRKVESSKRGHTD